MSRAASRDHGHTALLALLMLGGAGYFVFKNGLPDLTGDQPLYTIDPLADTVDPLIAQLGKFFTTTSSVGAPTANANVAAPAALNPLAPPAPGAPASAPRGIRNNNPTNIVYSQSNAWLGQIGSDGTFAQFDTAVHGIRAAFSLLRTYINNYALNSITEIAGRWAPAPVNNPATYAKSVSSFSGIAVNTAITFANQAQMIAVMKGLIATENGAGYVNYYPDATLIAAYQSA